MSQSIYCNPSLFIDNDEIPYSFTAKIDERGNNTINNASITIKTDRLNYQKYFGKEIVIYLNQGSADSVPIFRGYVKQAKPSDKTIQIKAQDPRCLLSGENTPDVDSFTYQGYTIAQFTHEWITDYVNKDKTRIGLDMLNETTPVQPFFTDVPLQVIAKAYDIIKRGISLNRDYDGQYKRYEIVMIDDGLKSNIHFLRDKDIDGPAACVFSDTDGIIKLDYNRKPIPNFLMIGNVKYQVGSQPNGPEILKSDYLPDMETYENTPAEVNDMVIQQLEMARIWNEKEIKLTASKGHYLNIGDIVSLEVEDNEINGKHKVTAKSFTIGANKMSISLTLSKRKPSMEELN